MATGNLTKARQAFERALSQPIDEAPNYAAFVRLAEVECMAGNRETGLWLLAEFECMLQVDVGERRCSMRTDGQKIALANPTLSPVCRELMCEELLLPYYENPSPQTLKRVEFLRSEMRRTSQVCRRNA